jgi:decaprenylphospho-beta-D-ribofuranose 2-oxidase
MIRKVALSGWGRQQWVETPLVAAEDLKRGSAGAALSRGLGRAYGDAALPSPRQAGVVMKTTPADRILAFDPVTGILRVEAGISVGELTRLLLDRGWFLPVVPGTRFVTLGGMVAADVHGKNHHVAQSFGRHVRALAIRAGDGRVYECSRSAHADLFLATIGGMGLTGHVLEVELEMQRVPSAWIYEESERFASLDEVFAALRAASAAWPMTVAWIDTSAAGPHTGRGIVARGRWAEPAEAQARRRRTGGSGIGIPFDLPNGLVNPFTIGVLNALWYHKHGSRKRQHFVAPETFFWPLDMVREWNRVFGRRGFIQYQCVLPSEVQIFREFLALFRSWRACSFVTVLKDCGAEGEGMLSFLKPGTTIALDIPVRKVEHARAMTRAFNELVLAHGGRIYLAKDSFTEADHFRRMYPRVDAWQAIRHRYDPHAHIGSAMADRLLGDLLLRPSQACMSA